MIFQVFHDFQSSWEPRLMVMISFSWVLGTHETAMLYGPVDEMSILNTYARMPPLNAHAGISSSTRGLNVDLINYLHP